MNLVIIRYKSKWIIDKCLLSQFFPVYVSGQAHVYSGYVASLHVPPFWHESALHASSAIKCKEWMSC